MKLENAYKEKDSEYYSLNRPELQGLVKNNLDSILDIGCSNGALASELKQYKQIKEAWGIEPVEEFGRVAETKLDKVFIMPVEEALPLLPANKFDLIMFADVLEHLIDPEYVLIELKNKLKPGGEIIASIPNIRHWSIFRQLLEGNWNYAEHGLLDKTHLRFFTRKTMISLFENAGYHAEVIGSQKVGNFEIPDNVMDMLNSAGLDVSTLRDEINVFQYFLRATLGKNAIFVPSQLFDQNMIAKLQSLSPNIKSNLKIFLLYKIPTPTVEFIKSLDEEKEGIGAVHVDEVKFDNYNQIGIITSPNFSIQDFETKFSITETVSANQNFLVFNSKNLPDTEIQNLIRFVQ